MTTRARLKYIRPYFDVSQSTITTTTLLVSIAEYSCHVSPLHKSQPLFLCLPHLEHEQLDQRLPLRSHCVAHANFQVHDRRWVSTFALTCYIFINNVSIFHTLVVCYQMMDYVTTVPGTRICKFIIRKIAMHGSSTSIIFRSQISRTINFT